jgi:ADP-ribosyl-[dinitrogen reductase] hydrolase
VVAHARSEPLAVAAGLLGWYRSHPKDIGNATRAVMSGVRAPTGLPAASRAYGRRIAALPKPADWHPGMANGSLMRTGPVALPYLGDRDRVAAAAREVSDLTHFCPYAGDSCVIWSLAIHAAVELGEAFAPAMVSEGIAFLPADRQGFWSATIAEALRQPPARFGMNGSAVGAFQCALSAVAHARSPEDGLQQAVAAGGDTDTTAAIAGALLGAVHGASAIPRAWRKGLHGWPGLDADGLEQLALDAVG